MVAVMIVQLLPAIAKQGNALGLFLKPSNAMLVKLGKKEIENKLANVTSRWPGGGYGKVGENELVSPKEYFSNT